MGWFKSGKDVPKAPAPAPVDDRLTADQVHVLVDGIAELISTVDHQRLLVSIVDKAIAAVGAERGILFLFGDGEPDKLLIQVARDRTGRDLPLPVQYSTTVTRKVATEGTPMCWKVSSHEGAVDLSRSIVDMKLRAVMCVTLRVKERRLGLIYVDSRANQREFTAADLRFFDALAGALSIGVENARLVQEAIAAERLKEQMKIARHIQEGLLPRDPKGLMSFDVAGRAIPAEEALGDYYDFVPVAERDLLVAIGDVSGHGLGPALLMSSARALLRSAVRGTFRLDEVLGRMNDQFARDSDGAIFMSLQLIELDDRERVLRFANAGHTAPLLLRADGAVETLPGDGLALGIEEGMPYDVSEPIQMNSGDVLVLITDGILEARRGDEVFGRERLAQSVVRSRDGDAAGVIRAIHQDVIQFTGSANQDDDVTLVVVKAR